MQVSGYSMTSVALFLVCAVTTAPVLGADTAAAASSTPAKAETCVPCHGVEGNSTVATFPVLAGQSARYIYLQLRDFKGGQRKDPLMSPIAETLGKEDMLMLAEYFAARKPKPIVFDVDRGKAAAGRKKADETLCFMCHLGGFSGQNEIPRVAGQHPEYVLKQLQDFKAKNRTNDAGNMSSVSKTLSDEDMENITHYIGTLN
jgi:cytochrome c553